MPPMMENDAPNPQHFFNPLNTLDPDPPSLLTKYVSCFPTTKGRSLSHSDRNAALASLLALRYGESLNIRRESTEIAEKFAVSYRRLEYYSEDTKMIDTLERDVRGKLMELSYTYDYKSMKRRSLDRRGEMKILIPAPIAIDCSDLAEAADSILAAVIEALERHGEHIHYLLEESDFKVIGCRDVPYGTRTWCDGTAMVSMHSPVEVYIRVESPSWSKEYAFTTENIYDLNTSRFFDTRITEKLFTVYI